MRAELRRYECVCTSVCVCVHMHVHACAHWCPCWCEAGAVFTRNALEVDIYQHLCAVKKHTSCCCPFIRFSEESGPHLWPGVASEL